MMANDYVTKRHGVLTQLDTIVASCYGKIDTISHPIIATKITKLCWNDLFTLRWNRDLRLILPLTKAEYLIAWLGFSSRIDNWL